MIIISLVNVPERTKGYVSRYLIEISPSVYIGSLDSKTRDRLWDYVRGNCGANGYSTMAYSKNTAQGYEILTQGDSDYRTIAEIDGIKLIAKTIPKEKQYGRTGWSRYSRTKPRRVKEKVDESLNPEK